MTLKDWRYIVFWAVFSFVWITFCADNVLGFIISVLMFVILLWYGVFRKETILQVILLLLFLIPEYPRDILFLYDALDAKEIFYNTINTVKIGPLTLYYWAMISLPIVIIVKSGLKISYASGVAVSILIGVIIYLFLVTLASSQSFNLSTAITNVKIYTILLCTFLLLSNWKEQELKAVLNNFLIFLPVIIGLRVILFITYDFTLGTPSWDYFTQPLITVIAFIYLLQNNNKTIIEKSLTYRILFYISLFSLSRALIAIVVISFIVAMFLSKKRVLKMKVLIEVVPFVTILCFTVLVTNPNLYNFLLWKVSDLNVFESKKEISGSGKVRQYEILNILDGTDSSDKTILIGFGLSGHFNFDKHKLPIQEALDSKSFSEVERLENRFYFPHSFLAANLLRGGILLTLIYVFVHLALAIHFYRRRDFYLSMLSIFLIYNSYVRVEYAILLSILILLALFTHKGRSINIDMIRQQPNE
ncbi:hypothetical protein ACSOOX_000058 [Escherichia coli]|nr:hypothetical protein [Escherichia coli]